MNLLIKNKFEIKQPPEVFYKKVVLEKDRKTSVPESLFSKIAMSATW